jgi:hypothetical protein
MIRDLGQRHFEKIEAAVQISYGVSLAHLFEYMLAGLPCSALCSRNMQQKHRA